MAFIKEEEINNIRQQANIVDIISGYVDLNKSGNDYVGICPFHDDHSPSMHVSPKLNIFKCFVCNTGGNVFSFVQKFENISYLEAVKTVAQKSGISFNHNISSSSFNKHKEEYEIMDLSLKLYQNNLASKEGIQAKEYLHKRGITDQIIKDFNIGLSLDDNKLTAFLENKKINLETSYKIGLLNKSGINYFDMFASRIMIPIYDNYGNLSGYTARSYLKEDKNKYINSKENVIYKKSDILFNYYQAKDIARIEKKIIIVEGNMDAISLASHGIKNVCALMGVVISPNQIKALQKLNAKVILMLDNDNAGKSATLAIGEQLYNSKIDTYVIRLSDAKDPDEYINKFGVSKLIENIKKPIRFLDYKIDSLKDNKNLDNVEELTNYIKEVINALQDAGELEREVVISKICKDYNIDPNVIKKNLTPIVKDEKRKPIPIQKKSSKYEKASAKLIYAMLFNKDFYNIYMDKLGYLRYKWERDMASLIGTYIKKYNNIDLSGFIDYIMPNEEVSKHIDDIIALNDEIIDDKQGFCDILNAVSKIIDEEEIKDLKMQIKEEKDVNKKIALIEKLTELKKGSGNNEGD